MSLPITLMGSAVLSADKYKILCPAVLNLWVARASPEDHGAQI